MSKAAKRIPYVLLWDKMPVDISWVFESEKPAGKHGFLKVNGEKFVFEDGTEARFWGTNFNSGAIFPEHSHSETVAKRLAMTGLNMVRFHQMDAEWATPNIFQYRKGKLLKDTRALDPDSMDRLDYLVYCLKREGIYIYMDFLTYRRFRTGDGVENAPALRESGKPYSNFDERMIELQKEFAKQFLEHYNPYTGLAYKDEPAIAMAEITNECDMFTGVQMQHFDDEPYRSELIKLYEDYAKKNGREIKSYDFEHKDALLNEFCCDLIKSYYLEMADYIKGIDMKCPITGTNWPKSKFNPFCNRILDYTDCHAYWWYGGVVLGGPFESRPHIKNSYTMTRDNVKNAVVGKPFIVSEWDTQWPNEYRADSPIMVAAHGMLQGWAGYTIHTYRYGTNETEAVTSKIGRLLMYGNSDYRGTFDTFNDPAKYGLFYHAALITRRGDVKEANETIVIGMSDKEMYETDDNDAFDRVGDTVYEKHKVRFDYNVPSVGDSTLSEDEVLSDTGEIYRNRVKGIGYVNTPMTKAVYGFAFGKTDLGDVSVDIKNEFATVAISSLTDDPISSSENMLVTAVGKAENTGFKVSEDGGILEEHGTAPVMIDVIEAEITIKTNQKHLKVWSVDNEGYYTALMPGKYENGEFTFKLGEYGASMYYLVQAQ